MKISLVLFAIVLFGTCSVVQSGRHRRGHHRQHSFGRVGRLGLRKVAQRSAQRAHNAVVDQHIAAQKASFVAKSVLAEAAFQAAETAEVALATKHALLKNLEKQFAEAHHALEAEIEQLQLAQHTAIAATETAQKAAKQVQILRKVVKQAQRLAGQAGSAAGHAQTELVSQKNMVVMAQIRLAAIEGKLHEVQADFAKTKKAAKKASAAAYAAYSNAGHLGGAKHGNNKNHGGLSGFAGAIHVEHIVQQISGHHEGFSDISDSTGGGHDAVFEGQVVK